MFRVGTEEYGEKYVGIFGLFCAPRFEIDISHMQNRNVSHFVIVLDETRGLDVGVMSGECVNPLNTELNPICQ